MRQPILALAVAAALAACSHSDSRPSAPPPPACHFSLFGVCYAGPSYTQQSCTVAGGVWLAQGCPAADVVGFCAELSGELTTYYSPYYTPQSGSYACSGTYTPIIGPTVSAWCDARGSYGICADLTGPEADLAQYATACSYIGGTWHTTGACPTAGRTGTCSYQSVAIFEADRYYNPATAASDAAACTAGGDSWTPG